MSTFPYRMTYTIFTELALFIRGVGNISDGFNGKDFFLNARITKIVVGVFLLVSVVSYIVYNLTKHLFTKVNLLADPSNLDLPTQRSITSGNRQQVAEAMHLTGLIHKVALNSFDGVDRIDGIFREGKLIPSKKSTSNANIKTPVIFLQAMTQSMLNNPNVLQYRLLTDWEKNLIGADSVKEMTEENRRIGLVFSLALLERKDYHANNGWYYGRMDPNFSYSPSQIDQFSAVVLKNESSEEGKLLTNNEVVFRHEIPLSALHSIIVHPDDKTELLKKIESIPPPDGIPSWEAIIQVREEPALALAHSV